MFINVKLKPHGWILRSPISELSVLHLDPTYRYGNQIVTNTWKPLKFNSKIYYLFIFTTNASIEELTSETLGFIMVRMMDTSYTKWRETQLQSIIFQ